MLTKKQIKAIEELTKTKAVVGILPLSVGNHINFTSDNNNFVIYWDETQFIITEVNYIEVKWLAPLGKILEDK